MEKAPSSLTLLQLLGVSINDKIGIQKLSREIGIPSSRLIFYDRNNLIPSGRDLDVILKYLGINETLLMLKLGKLDSNVISAIQRKADLIYKILDVGEAPKPPEVPEPIFKTTYGKLYQCDCYQFLKSIESDSVDLIFADPPFNLNKNYPSGIDDNQKEEKYILWCKQWVKECIRILKPGGAFFIWNLPKWNIILANYLNNWLTFRHWIAVDIKYRLPIKGRLYPSHYSLIYYIKGNKPRVFQPDRLPMQICPKCYADLKDYGGYKNKMNPKGVNLSDVWTDIPPVRHSKYKGRKNGNELSIKLLDRIIQMCTLEGDIVVDPFGGSGTTYIVAEIKKRRWLGCEIGPVDDIISRFERLDKEKDLLTKYRLNLNSLFPDEIKRERKKLGLWTCESFEDNQHKSKQINLF